MRPWLENWLNDQWYHQGHLCHLLAPCAWLYKIITNSGEILPSTKTKKPIWVIGNMTAGGVGKTPLTMALAVMGSKLGLRVLVVIKPYRVKPLRQSKLIKVTDDPEVYGDEPCLIKKNTQVDVLCVAKDRSDLAVYFNDYDLFICDDGLQDVNCPRALNWMVINASRKFGNGHLLPRGPLRSALKWLKNIDYTVVRDGSDSSPLEFCVRIEHIECAMSGAVVESDFFKDKKVLVCCGIGDPHNFFSQMQNQGIQAQFKVFSDHHNFTTQDISFINQYDAVIVTEKDAIKLIASSVTNMYVAKTKTVMNAKLANLVNGLLKQVAESDTIMA